MQLLTSAQAAAILVTLASLPSGSAAPVGNSSLAARGQNDLPNPCGWVNEHAGWLKHLGICAKEKRDMNVASQMEALCNVIAGLGIASLDEEVCSEIAQKAEEALKLPTKEEACEQLSDTPLSAITGVLCNTSSEETEGSDLEARGQGDLATPDNICAGFRADGLGDKVEGYCEENGVAPEEKEDGMTAFLGNVWKNTSAVLQRLRELKNHG